MAENIIGNQINKLRKKMGWSQPQLGEKLNVSRQTISNWENGVKTPRMGALQQLSDLFHVSIGYITDGNEEHESQKDIAQMIDDGDYMTFQGKELTDEDKELLKRLLRK
ncbi:XRE family transcriptional regulator [Apilactobacillus timberlakei]|uniref:helix-turn-helix domain-containing protein n=1 Tax=Apilactobacillus timberlakei TaxID=2008380 RepID=UPI00112C528A|nr:helix-turn-helix transcriptional regulator [Apilactobacillus timberlakei]TPR21472.1 XRE family transcriptional regulator [Apilactobacillus timberlakei]